MGTKAIFTTALATAAVLFSTAVAQSSSSYYEEAVGTVKFNMIFVEGGTFTKGCSGSGNSCQQTEQPTHSVTLSDYYVSSTEVTTALYNAVMGTTQSPNACNFFEPPPNQRPMTGVTWYDAIDFTCELSKKTGRKYRLLTDAEFEYAARGGKKTQNYLYSGSNNADLVAWHSGNSSGGFGARDVGGKNANELGIYDMSGNVYEWVYDNWGSFETGTTNPTTEHRHTQKTRRGGSYDQPATESRVYGRKIRSIEGADGSIGIRLAYSENYPDGMADPCTIKQPHGDGGAPGFRDMRMVTGDNEAWVYEMEYQGMQFTSMIKIWDNGTAVYKPSYGSNVFGEWYTLSNFTFHIVPSSGSERKFIYYMIGPDDLSMMAVDDMPARWMRRTVSDIPSIASLDKPSIANIRSGETLAPAGYDASKMLNPPTTGRDPKLKEGNGNMWVQDNVCLNAGGSHRYRKDFNDDDYARFVVWDGNSPTILADGTWFTVDDVFLRISKNGKNYDYLYQITSGSDPTLYHISYQGYEPGDFRMFKKSSDNDSKCGCTSQYIPDNYSCNVAGSVGTSSSSNPYESCNVGGSFYIPPDENYTLPSSSSGVSPIIRRDNPLIGDIGVQTKYYNLQGQALGNAKPQKPGIYIAKNIETGQTRKMVVR